MRRRQGDDYEGKYILNEDPVFLQPSLAQMIGHEHAIWLQTLHFLLRKPFAYSAEDYEEPVILQSKLHEGRRFVRIEFKQLLHPNRGRLRFFSESTLQRLIKESARMGYTLVAELNDNAWDHTNWYALDLDRILEDEKKFEAQIQRLVADYESSKNPRLKRAVKLTSKTPAKRRVR